MTEHHTSVLGDTAMAEVDAFRAPLAPTTPGTDDLRALSEAATPSPWETAHGSIVGGTGDNEEPVGDMLASRDAIFTTALVNAYRSGELAHRAAQSPSTLAAPEGRQWFDYKVAVPRSEFDAMLQRAETAEAKLAAPEGGVTDDEALKIGREAIASEWDRLGYGQWPKNAVDARAGKLDHNGSIINAVRGAKAALATRFQRDTDRLSFTILDGHEAVRDADGRATGETRPLRDTGGAEEPLGAAINGRVFADRMERDYSFECEAGPLLLCSDWQEFRRCFEALAEYVESRCTSTATPAAAEKDEPVAWECTDPTGTKHVDYDDIDGDQELGGWTSRPLYAAPRPDLRDDVVREALEQIARLNLANIAKASGIARDALSRLTERDREAGRSETATQKSYRCSACLSPDPTRWRRCDYADCPDKRGRPMTAPTDREKLAAALDRTISRLQALHPYAARPAWEAVLQEELAALLSTPQPTAEASSWRAPDGWALVPREPTPDMRRAGDMYTNCGGPCGNRAGADAYRAMLAAAPPPPAEESPR